MNNPDRLSHLIAARIIGTSLTDEENRMLDDWLEASPKNRQLFERVREMKLAARMLELDNANYGKRMATKFKQHIHARERRYTLKRFFIRMSVAACLFIGLFLTYNYLYRSEPEMSDKTSAFVITPGGTAATLTLADGRQIDVQGKGQEEVTQLLDSIAHAIPQQAISAELAYHTLSIPAGGEFECYLPDGTHVWLNSQSSLRFPEAFSDTERKVYLQGEAFFDVKKDTERPFIVNMDEANIEVYGTRFNVTNYADLPLSAVLVEGSIGLTTEQGNPVRIASSQRITYNRENGNINVETVNTSVYTAWVEKRFVFEGQTLEDIMKTLARWYDFTPVFTSDSIRHIRFSGRLNRHDDIRILLQSYETATGIKFRIEERTIFITQ